MKRAASVILAIILMVSTISFASAADNDFTVSYNVTYTSNANEYLFSFTFSNPFSGSKPTTATFLPDSSCDFSTQSTGAVSIALASSGTTGTLRLKTVKTTSAKLSGTITLSNGADPNVSKDINLTVILPQPPEDPFEGGTPVTPIAPTFFFTTTTTAFTPGENRALTVTIDKMGGSSFWDTRIYIDNSECYDKIGLAASYVDIKTNAGKGSVDVKINIPSGTPTGSYPLSLILVGKYGDDQSFTIEKPIKVNVVNQSPSTPVSGLSFVKVEPTVSGSKLTLKLSIRNNSSAQVNNIKLFFDEFSPDNFYPADNVGETLIQSIAANATYVATTVFTLGSEVKSGNYPITAKLSYVNGAQSDTKSTVIYVPVNRSLSPELLSGQVGIVGTSFDRTVIGEDNKATLIVDVINLSGTDITGLTAALADASSATLSQYEDFGSVSIGSIAKGKTGRARFKVYVAPALTTGNYPVKLSFKYKLNGADQTGEAQAFVTVTRSGGANGGKSKPRMIISGYSYDTPIINAGQPFKLNFEIANTSTTSALKNIKLVISSPEGVFAPTEGSNAFYIPEIEAGGTYAQEINLVSKLAAETKSYPVVFSLEYEDTDNTSYNSEETISLPVTLPMIFEVTNFNPPQSSGAGQPIPIYFQFINKGKANMENLSISVQGDFTCDLGEFYYGRLAGGASDFYEAEFMPIGEGLQNGKIVFEYENAAGVKEEYVKDFSIDIMPMGDPTMGGVDGKPVDGGVIIDPGMPPVEGGGNSLLKWIIIGAAVVVIGGGATAIILVRRKRKKLKELEADEID